MADVSILDLILHWVLLLAVFLFLTALFRERVILEGALGYLLAMVVIIPMNLFVRLWVESMGLDFSQSTWALMGTMLLLNLGLLFVLSRAAPGVTISSIGAMLVFAAALSAASFLIRYLPPLPTFPGGVFS
ncbi:MAG TPA: hypothetical protein VM492_11325 [Sumerlaeia bacterium]|nr:hypothetical protein [Sumerlaeia bacterium]